MRAAVQAGDMGRPGWGVAGHGRIATRPRRAAAVWLLCATTAHLLACVSAQEEAPPPGPPVTSQTVFSEDECPSELPDAAVDAVFRVEEDGAATPFQLPYAMTFATELAAGLRTIE